MVVKLVAHEHGKGRVRLLKVDRQASGHNVFQIEAQILVEGPAEKAYLDGDNSGVLPTDSVKNTVYSLAKKHELASIEDFGVILATHFVEKHPSIIHTARVKLVETEWTRLITPDSKGQMRPHHHAFIGGGHGISFTHVVARKSPGGGDTQISVTSGLENVKLLKTTKSAFVNFFRDEYTTLPDVPDRLVATSMKVSWSYSADAFKESFKKQAADVKCALLDAFGGPSDVGVDSPAVQYSLYKMGEAVLAKVPTVKEITINMPNIHNLPVDLSKFGLKNIHPHGEIFLPTDEPHGIIQATISRSNSKL